MVFGIEHSTKLAVHTLALNVKYPCVVDSHLLLYPVLCLAPSTLVRLPLPPDLVMFRSSLVLNMPLPAKLVAFRSLLALNVPPSTKELACFVGGDKSAVIFGLLFLRRFIFILLKHTFTCARSLIVGVPNNTRAICSYPYPGLGAMHVRLHTSSAEIINHYGKVMWS